MKCFLVSRTKQGSSVPAVSSDTVTAECSVPAVYQLPPHYLECPPCCFIHVSVSHLALLICLKHLQYFQLIYLLGPPSSAWDNQHSLWGTYNIFSTHHFLALHMEVVRRVQRRGVYKRATATQTTQLFVISGCVQDQFLLQNPSSDSLELVEAAALWVSWRFLEEGSASGCLQTNPIRLLDGIADWQGPLQWDALSRQKPS